MKAKKQTASENKPNPSEQKARIQPTINGTHVTPKLPEYSGEIFLQALWSKENRRPPTPVCGSSF
jgi:hypothetical protein